MRTRLMFLALLVLIAGCNGGTMNPLHSGIQHPQLKPAKGTHEAPVEVVGAMPTTTWSGTTVESAVPNQDGVKIPRKGQVVTRTGEIIDVSCYLQLGKHGEGHRECGVKCAKEGNPIGLLTADGSVYLLMAEEHHPRRDGDVDGLRKKLIERMAEIIKVTGTETELNGQKAIFVSGFAK